MSLFPLGLISQGGGATAGPVGLELISTQVLVSGASTVSFSSLPTSYKHLQIRFAWNGPSDSVMLMRFNSDSTSSYVSQGLSGNGSTVYTQSYASSSINMTGGFGLGDTTYVNAGVCNILDVFNTNKYKSAQVFTGNVRSALYETALMFGRWANTSAISSISLINDTGNFSAGSRFSIYGSNA